MAMATVALVFATAGVAFVAWYQIGAARKDATKNRTILACDRYDTDPTVDRASTVLARARDDGTLGATPERYRVELFTVLNFVESLAIGVEQRFYDEAVVRAYMEPIFRGYIEEYLITGLADRADPTGVHDSYTRLIALCNKWGCSYKLVRDAQ